MAQTIRHDVFPRQRLISKKFNFDELGIKCVVCVGLSNTVEL